MNILHAADFHLDSPFQRLDAARAMERRRELRELPAALVKLAREEGVDLILLPGDLFDGERVFPETLRALTEALGSVDIPVVIAPGNHDCVRPGSPYLTAQWPDNVHIFTGSEMDCVHFPALNCTVHGCAFTTPHRTDEPLAGFSAPADGSIHLLCLHGEVGTDGNYAPIPPEALAGSGATYAALGHIHAASGLNREGDTFWAYCGCPEGRGFDELGEKGVCLIHIEDGGVTAHFRALCRRQYRIERVEAGSFDDWLAGEPGGDLVRVILTGESPTAPDLEELRRQAGEKFFYLELRDETTLTRDLWDRAEEDTLTGLFLREMRQELDRAPEEDRAAVLLAVRFGLAALEGGEDVCP